METNRLSFNDDFLYEVLKNRDGRFDGRFFFGVTSTGIYCRPICPARRPRRENCRFFASASAAESAGFRPCLRCHPEQAPGLTGASQEERLVALAASALQSGAGVKEAAGSLGVSERRLRRVFSACRGVSPVQYAQTFRLLFARRLILETELSLLQTALAAGFGSLRRMNALFRQRYRCKPSELRGGFVSDVPDVVLFVACRQPYAWREMLGFLTPRAIEGVEEARESLYRRVLSLEDRVGWVSVSYDEKKSALRVEVSSSLMPVLGRLIARLKRVFDTDTCPEEVSQAIGSMADACPGLRVPGAFDAFEMGARAILGQQVTVRAAHTILTRVTRALGEETPTPFPFLCRAFPSPRKFLEADETLLGGLGVVRNRQRALRALAEFALSGGLEPRADIERQISDLKKLPGIGEWTAQYLAMRALDWPNAFPHTDSAIKAAMGNRPPNEILNIAERWRPWRAYAAMYLWLNGREKAKGRGSAEYSGLHNHARK
ncbi:MAG: helix-turn-helix domain-containing protein [Synergistaceae bacterium]|jgi:AraC family transcriptional regulator of adaptative response / DNA-3-methyladenine glycosylase II|nr:helix-turn-helix domain-containing protein [Synergistaceae bacterium]